MALFSPYDVERVYGQPFSYIDITKEYDNLVANPEIRKYYLEARELENEISKLQQESGYPYILNIDTANRSNPIPGKIIMSNLCSEILQVQTPAELDDGQNYVKMGRDVSCNLGSTNILNLMKSKDFGQSVNTMVRALTFVADSSNIVAVPTVAYGNQLSHAIGLGAMGLHTFLADHEIEYGSAAALEFTSTYFMLLNYWTLVASNEIARERQATFAGFADSDYASGKYFERYQQTNYQPKLAVVKALFKDIFIPGPADWAKLSAAVQKDGLYNQNRLAVAPTGSISYINDTSASIHPITRLIEERTEKKNGNFTSRRRYSAIELCLTTNPPTTPTCAKSSTHTLLLKSMWIKA
jgi:Ribonucleotide reductase, alpha subunit